jgi:hypothetical protein
VRKFALALVVTMVVVGAAVVRANGGHGIPPGNGLSPAERLGVQGDHHHVDRDLGLVEGRDLIVDDVVVGTDRIAIRYHATGIHPVQFGGDSPACVQNGPTLIIATADGKALTPFEGSDQNENGSSAVLGEMVFRWQGGKLHHLKLSIARIMCDEHAHWTTSFDF